VTLVESPVYACSYESHIKNILESSKLLSERYESSQQLTREQIEVIIPAIHRTAKKLKALTELMKRDASEMESKNPVG